MIVFRLENAEGKGPYRVDHRWSARLGYAHSDGDHPAPKPEPANGRVIRRAQPLAGT